MKSYNTFWTIIPYILFLFLSNIYYIGYNMLCSPFDIKQGCNLEQIWIVCHIWMNLKSFTLQMYTSKGDEERPSSTTSQLDCTLFPCISKGRRVVIKHMAFILKTCWEKSVTSEGWLFWRMTPLKPFSTNSINLKPPLNIPFFGE